MTIRELKNHPYYEFECNMSSEDYKGDKDCDEWGASFVWLGDDIGVEYNICIVDGHNCSAIYCMFTDSKNEYYMETDTSKFIHYEIDFVDDDWKSKLENAMCKAMIELHNLK